MRIHAEAHAHEETEVEHHVNGVFTNRRFEVKEGFVECFTE
jgi:hypothetical protein